MKTDDYLFVALTANTRVRDESTAAWIIKEKSAKLEIKPFDANADRYLREVWGKMQLAAEKFHAANGETIPGWAEWKVHDWATKTKGCEDRQKFMAWHGATVAGFINLRPAFPSQKVTGKGMVYVEHMAASPGNQRTKIWCRYLKHVGEALLAYAVFESKRQGFDGLIGLHAADEEARKYYTALNAGRSNLLFHPEMKDVPGVLPHGESAKNKSYFESTLEGANQLLEDYRNA
jgi:hypothetical protein